MASGTRRPASAPYPVWFAAALTVGLFGLLAAAIGLWIALAEGSFTLTVFFWSWKAAEIADLWGPTLLIGGGAVAVLGVGTALLAGGGRVLHGWVGAMAWMIGALGIGAVVVGIWRLF